MLPEASDIVDTLEDMGIHVEEHARADVFFINREDLEKLMEMASRDQLTGLWNRKSLEQRLEKAVGTRFALMIVDVDHFKKVNDTHGHDVGDDVIRYVVGKLRPEYFGRDAVVARWGGEEFAILMRDDHKGNTFRHAAERVRKAVAERGFVIHDTSIRIPITVSIGVRIVSAKEEDLKVIFKDADEALYRAKDAGRNRVVFHPNKESLKIV